MELRPMLALIGIILGAISAEFNSQVVGNAIGDIGGALFLSHDSTTWFSSIYTTAEVVGMALAPWSLATFTLRQFTLFALVINVVASLPIPYTSDVGALYLLRGLQGFGEGLTIPLLFTTALRVLPPNIRVYGFAVYALTATFTPGIATSLAALWTNVVGWQFVFLQTLPMCLLGGLLVWWGEDQDEPHYERLRQFDWRGALLVMLGFGSLSTALQQGDRLDWFNSPLICILLALSVVAIPLLLVNEWFHELPLFKLQILGRANFAYGVIALFSFLLVGQAASTVPGDFLRQVQGFRPEQIYTVTLVIALSQLVLLPATAFLLDHESVDGRAVSFLGYALILAGCLGAAKVTPDWYPAQFYAWQVLFAIGQPLVVMPLLLMASGAVKGPEEAPMASGLVNAPRALAEATGVWLLQLITRWRGGLHYNRIADQAGQDRWEMIQAPAIPPYGPPPLLPNGHERAPGSLDGFQRAVEAQVQTLTAADTYVVLAGIVVFLIVVLAVLPRRQLPPRVVEERKKAAAA